MSDYTPIACDDYDVLELACTDRYEIALVLGDEDVVGTALTLRTDGSAEYLVVRLADGATRDVRIDRIRRLVVRSRPARVDTHVFGAA